MRFGTVRQLISDKLSENQRVIVGTSDEFVRLSRFLFRATANFCWSSCGGVSPVTARGSPLVHSSSHEGRDKRAHGCRGFRR